MHTLLSLGGEKSFELKHALLVYHNGKRVFVTLHDPMPGQDGRPAQLGSGSPVTSAFLRELSDGLGAALPAEVLPSNVVCRTADVTVWWRPSGVAALFYATSEQVKKKSEFKAISGKPVPHPALVFKATRSALWVRALARNERPSASTPLFEAPYFNVSTTGGVCLGSMRRPSTRGIAAMGQWERGFFESEFTHPLPGARMTSYAGGFTKLWADLAAGAKRSKRSFPVDALVRAKENETLEQFIRSTDLGKM